MGGDIMCCINTHCILCYVEFKIPKQEKTIVKVEKTTWQFDEYLKSEMKEKDIGIGEALNMLTFGLLTKVELDDIKEPTKGK